ncbi:hypothetical protein Cgig2_031371 [Carnegiea gigantea]|uniref:Beta-galactosidase galactose-binding domain-containing protein n=1 Tax=Carnegiea gigantea TaxID=171969 RepID=A0A9Q1Q3Q2_9CARY|nr:hypothetical protein Cgig2_031371 [Carnegiea gigantea]
MTRGGVSDDPTDTTTPPPLTGVKGDETVIKDLSLHSWKYRTGLQGLDHELLFSERSPYASRQRSGGSMALNTSMTWYKIIFKAPLGTEPVVVNLSDMGKGEALFNGMSISSFVADKNGCTVGPYTHRGQYAGSKCLTNYGQPTQILYHVPWSFLRDDDNTLVLFEELGGNPSYVNFETISIGKAYGNAYEGNTLELSCEQRPIFAINFTSFGTCGAFVEGSCKGDKDALNILS